MADDHGFSSHPGHGNGREIAESFPGINHKSIGTQYDGYVGGVSAPTLNDPITTYVGVEVRSIVPDTDSVSDDVSSHFSQNSRATDSADNN